MPQDVEAQLTYIKGKSKAHPERERQQRDPSLTGGERAETAREKTTRARRKAKPKQPPMVQRTP
jgi:hypothetical protein